VYVEHRVLEGEVFGRNGEAVHLAARCVSLAQQDAERAGCRERQIRKQDALEPVAGLIGWYSPRMGRTGRDHVVEFDDVGDLR